MVLSKPLYLITDGGALRSKNLLELRVQAALGGASGRIAFVQLREQMSDSGFAAASDDEILQLLKKLTAACHTAGAKILINRRLDLALAGGADGVHLGGGNPVAVAAARKELGSSATVGYSAHQREEALSAMEHGASYILYGPVFPPLSKVSARSPLGLDALFALTSKVSVPVYGLGGITVANAGLCRQAGATGVACITSIVSSPDPHTAVQQMLTAWDS